jgi:hypothetical protein
MFLLASSSAIALWCVEQKQYYTSSSSILLAEETTPAQLLSSSSSSPSAENEFDPSIFSYEENRLLDFVKTNPNAFSQLYKSHSIAYWAIVHHYHQVLEYALVHFPFCENEIYNGIVKVVPKTVYKFNQEMFLKQDEINVKKTLDLCQKYVPAVVQRWEMNCVSNAGDSIKTAWNTYHVCAFNMYLQAHDKYAQNNDGNFSRYKIEAFYNALREMKKNGQDVELPREILQHLCLGKSNQYAQEYCGKLYSVVVGVMDHFPDKIFSCPMLAPQDMNYRNRKYQWQAEILDPLTAQDDLAHVQHLIQITPTTEILENIKNALLDIEAGRYGSCMKGDILTYVRSGQMENEVAAVRKRLVQHRLFFHDDF